MRIQKLSAIALIGIILIPFGALSQSWQEYYDKAVTSLNSGNPAQALPDAEKALELAEKEFGKIHYNYINTLSKLFEIHYQTGNYEKALEFAEKDLELTDSLSGKDSVHYIKALFNIGLVYKETGSYQKAAEYIQEAINLSKNHPDYDKSDYAVLLGALAYLYKENGKYTEAEALYQEALSIQQSNPNEDYAANLNNLGLLYTSMGKYDEAASILTTAANLIKSIYGEDNKDYAVSLANTALVYYHQAYYSKAEPLYTKAMDIIKKSDGENNQEYALLLNNLAELYKNMGRYSEVEHLYFKALKIYENIFGQKHPYYGLILNNLALLYHSLGRYPEAEKYFNRSKQIFYNSFGADHPNYAASLSNLALLYHEMGRFDEAIENCANAIGTIENIAGKYHPELARPYNNLASLYQDMGDYENAEKLYLHSLSILDSAFDGNHPFYVTVMQNLAYLYKETWQMDKAGAMFDKSLELMRSTLGEQHADYFKLLNNRASFFKQSGDIEKAEKLYLDAHDNFLFHFDKNHPYYPVILINLSVLYQEKGDMDKAKKYLVQAMHLYLNQVYTFFPSLSAKEKNKFYYMVSGLFDYFNSIAVDMADKDPGILKDMTNFRIATKALLLNAARRIRQSILESDDEYLKQMFRDWVSKREHLNNLYSLPKAEVKKQKMSIRNLENEVNKLEKDISQRSGLFRKMNKSTDWNDIRQHLGKNEAAVEIIKIRKYGLKDNPFIEGEKIPGFTDTSAYAALIIKSGSKSPEIVIIDNGYEMDNKFAKDYGSMAAKSKSAQNKAEVSVMASALYNVYWQPIADNLQGIEKVYISPDAVYNKINLNTLFNEDKGQYLIDYLEIIPVSNLKDILRENYELKGHGKAELFGDPLFRLQNKDIDSVNTPINTDPGDREFDPLESLARNGISELPDTKKEVDKIAEKLKQNQWQYNVFLDAQASEIALKQVKTPDILHIATHGVFLNDARITNQGPGSVPQKYIENPLLRSMLLFSGAENTLRYNSFGNVLNSYAENDGILTAYEAMNINLERTELVVLSACETGLGDIKNGEGVYGLQRAFIVAGANSVIMSLWNVSDRATQMLMTDFYNNWFSGMEKKAAFRKAQLDLKEKFPGIYYWGAFIMIGI